MKTWASSALTRSVSVQTRLCLNARAIHTPAAIPELYDVVCVGGGPAGLSLINALKAKEATRELRLALIETQDLTHVSKWQHAAAKQTYSNRCSSLTPASVRFLKSMGVWEYVEHSRVRPYHAMKVWDGVSGARITFDWSSDTSHKNQTDQTGSTIAHMIENNNLVSALLTKSEGSKDLRIFDKTRVDKIEFGKDLCHFDMQNWPTLELSDGSSIAGRLLVGADGPRSLVRQFAGISSRGWNYERHGVVATVKVAVENAEASSMNTAYQRFLPTGPVALLPLPEGYASLVWSTTPTHAAALKKLSPHNIVALFNAAFKLSAVDLDYLHNISDGQEQELNWRLQHTPSDPSLVPFTIVEVDQSSVASFPLRLNHVESYVGERIALVGDAAHTIHPLAGQGLNQGQADVEALANAIETAVHHGQDIGNRLSLEPFNTERYAANNTLMGFVDKLHKIYSTSSEPFVTTRSIGLSAVDAVAPLKKFFMHQAAGAS